MGSLSVVSAPSTSSASSSPRYHGLDSLRGLAAATVVFAHFGNMYARNVPSQGFWGLIRYPFVAAHESVMLFFTLSGFVLTLPYLRGKSLPYSKFVIRRITRIYLPYLAALTIAVAGAYLFHRHLGRGAWAEQTWSEPVSLRLVLQHVLFIGTYDRAQFNTSFWSLIYEMRISLVFPFLFLIVKNLRNRVALVASAILAISAKLLAPHLSAASPFGWFVDTVQYLDLFVFGLILARNLDQGVEWLTAQARWARILLFIACLLLYVCGHTVVMIHIPGLWAATETFIGIGAAGCILISLSSATLREALSMQIPTFLGRVSYSAYLVHGTVLFAMTIMIGDRMHWWSAFGLYLAIAVPISYLFCLWVEEPCQRLGRVLTSRSSIY